MIFFTYDEDNYDSEEVRESVKYEELRKVKGIWIDRRYASSPEDIPYYKGNKEWADKEWYGEGKNHRVTDGMIERDFEEEFSIIELNAALERPASFSLGWPKAFAKMEFIKGPIIFFLLSEFGGL